LRTSLPLLSISSLREAGNLGAERRAPLLHLLTSPTETSGEPHFGGLYSVHTSGADAQLPIEPRAQEETPSWRLRRAALPSRPTQLAGHKPLALTDATARDAQRHPRPSPRPHRRTSGPEARTRETLFRLSQRLLQRLRAHSFHPDDLVR
jgi:hypothetical protein